MVDPQIKHQKPIINIILNSRYSNLYPLKAACSLSNEQLRWGTRM